MTTETVGAETPAASEDASVENSESATEQRADTESSGEAGASAETGENSGDDAADKPKRRHWAHERIDQLTRQRHDAERQAEYWKRKAEENNSNDLDNLDYEDQIAEKVRRANRREQAETAAEQAKQAADAVFQARADEARDKYGDYDVVVGNPHLPITPSMADVIKDSDVGPDLAYHLGKNPREAARIAELPAHRQAAELGRLEARLSAPKPQPRTPPAPVQPVNGIAAGGSKDPGSMSMAEYAAWRKANS